MMKVIGLGTYPVGRVLQIASGPAAIGRTTVLVQRAEDHILHPATIQVEAVAGSVNHTLVEADDGSTRAGHILTGVVGQKDFPHGREGISSVPVAGRLSLLLSR